MGFSSDLKEIRGDCNLSLKSQSQKKKIWFILNSLYCLSLHIHVCLIEMAFLASAPFRWLWFFLGKVTLKFPWRSMDFLKSQPHLQHPNHSLNPKYNSLTFSRRIKTPNKPAWPMQWFLDSVTFFSRSGSLNVKRNLRTCSERNRSMLLASMARPRNSSTSSSGFMLSWVLLGMPWKGSTRAQGNFCCCTVCYCSA